MNPLNLGTSDMATLTRLNGVQILTLTSTEVQGVLKQITSWETDLCTLIVDVPSNDTQFAMKIKVSEPDDNA